MRLIVSWAVIAAACSAAATAAPDAGVDPRVAEARADLDEAAKLKFAGKFAEGVQKAEHALALMEAALGPADVEVARCLNLAGDLRRRQGDLARAQPLLQRGLAIREAALDKAHPDIAESLNSLGALYAKQGLYDRAQPLYERALAIREAALGEVHPDVAESLAGLAVLYWRLGRYDRSEDYHRRTIAVRTQTLGKLHPAVAAALANLANVSFDEGRYDQAEDLFEQAIAIEEAVLGKAHPLVATALNNLANVYMRQGRYVEAEKLLQRAIAIRETALGKVHPDVAESLLNFGQLCSEQGRYDRAEGLFQRVLDIEEAALGRSNPEFATSLEAVGFSYVKQGRYGRAKPLLDRALAIREAAFDEGHPDVAESLYALARLHAMQGQYGQAEPRYQRALDIREAALGPTHPLVADTLNDLALLRLGQRRLAAATPLFARAFAISEGRLRRETLGFAEASLATFLQFLAADEQRLYSLARAHPDDPGVRHLALTASLLLRGRSVEEAAQTSRTILESLDPQDRQAFERLRGLRTQLAKLSLDGPGELAPADYRRRLKELGDEGDALEQDLARRSAPLRALAALPPPDQLVERVAAALPEDGALVELIAYTERPLVPGPAIDESKRPGQARYLAVVLFPDGRTGAVDLGPAADIDAASLRLRNALASREAAFQPAAQQLYRLAFKPLLPLLGKTRRVFLSPDGQLALVPLAALHDGRRFVADAFDITYLTSGLDLLHRAGGDQVSTSVVVLADPDFAAAPAPAGGVAPASERSRSVERFFAEQRAGLSGRRWASLPGTRQEAEAIQRLLPRARLFLGADASKEQLFRISAPGILHIATHGFFLEDASARPGDRGLAEVGGPSLPEPLFRSGLVLAGVGASEDLSSSLVTALELAGLNLWGTQLVVLSACDTGRGDVKLGQGVHGLRRALVVAGAETLVVSLWKVDDETTRTMMESYYRNLLAGQGRVAALRQAMLSLRAQHPHPHEWAPFIAIGQDSPLRGMSPP